MGRWGRGAFTFSVVVSTGSLALLGACSGGGSASSTASPSPTPSPSPTLPSGEPVFGATLQAESAEQDLCRTWASVRSDYLSLAGQNAGDKLQALVRDSGGRRIASDAESIGSDSLYQKLKADAADLLRVPPDAGTYGRLTAEAASSTRTAPGCQARCPQ